VEIRFSSGAEVGAAGSINPGVKGMQGVQLCTGKVMQSVLWPWFDDNLSE
jgi:hypothetical protein